MRQAGLGAPASRRVVPSGPVPLAGFACFRGQRQPAGPSAASRACVRYQRLNGGTSPRGPADIFARLIFAAQMLDLIIAWAVLLVPDKVCLALHFHRFAMPSFLDQSRLPGIVADFVLGRQSGL
ncbi:hypothetical protein ABZP36_029608 [Zizania latifolia]